MLVQYSAPMNGLKNDNCNDESQEGNSFHEAAEKSAYSKSMELLDTIGETQITLNLFLNNDFELAEERMAVLADRSMYHALGHGTILFIKAMMTCDRADMERGMEAMRNAALVIDGFRARYTIADSIYRIGGQYKILTEEQIHAELCYAESLMFRAILTFFYDESLVSFIKGSFKIRSCYQSFKECHRILNSDCWKEKSDSVKSQEIKRQFECGVRMGIGAFNLMLSTLPTKLLRLLEVVGFSGNKVSALFIGKLAKEK
ncbi:tetratricopeptide repeat protein 39B [Ditylenchus destructor]|uniref:Tetratricopeptide repeat protein 39B n=1 Tax=Ditylenchus destructor TaxID=166010 RepID=A0AAD4NFS8_9BILA|nr:tetratricopeptide repeat protein 39B [Ditylenchus destructor]